MTTYYAGGSPSRPKTPQMGQTGRAGQIPLQGGGGQNAFMTSGGHIPPGMQFSAGPQGVPGRPGGRPNLYGGGGQNAFMTGGGKIPPGMGGFNVGGANPTNPNFFGGGPRPRPQQDPRFGIQPTPPPNLGFSTNIGDVLGGLGGGGGGNDFMDQWASIFQGLSGGGGGGGGMQIPDYVFHGPDANSSPVGGGWWHSGTSPHDAAARNAWQMHMRGQDWLNYNHPEGRFRNINSKSPGQSAGRGHIRNRANLHGFIRDEDGNLVNMKAQRRRERRGGRGGGVRDDVVDDNVLFTPNDTQRAINAFAAQAFTNSDPNSLAKQFARPGVSMDEGTMANIAPQIGRTGAAVNAVSQALPMQDFLANQQFQLANQQMEGMNEIQRSSLESQLMNMLLSDRWNTVNSLFGMI